MNRHLTRAHAWLYDRSGGRLGRRVGGHPVLLLTTTGRTSGLPRRTPVQYEQVAGELLLVAAAGGAPEPPQWWHNLEADDQVRVQIGAVERPAQARTLDGADREAAWAELCERNHWLPGVQEKAGRVLPIVRVRAVPGH